MQSLTRIREILSSLGQDPKRSLGQNFLIDQNMIRKLVDAAGISPGELVLEVGPGTGTMTEELLSRGARVMAIELDDALASFLPVHFASHGDRFTLVHGDCLEEGERLNPRAAALLDGHAFKLVANLPYSASVPLIAALLTRRGGPVPPMYVTVQREVAQRLTAEPSTKDRGPLSILASAVARVRSIATLPPTCFWPAPEVTSRMIAIEPRENPLTDDPAGLLGFARRIFVSRRKQLGGVLGSSVGVWPGGLSPTMRAEELTTEQVLALWKTTGL